MKTNFFSLAIAAVISLSLISTNVNAAKKQPLIDTICCSPDSLQIISRNFPVFCVGWKVSADSNCIQPYGFEIEWAAFPGGLWTSKTVIYTGGPWVTFCDSVTECRTYQWRVRTICITGVYSNWVYGPKIAMICPFRNAPGDAGKNPVAKPVNTGKLMRQDY